MTGLPTGPGIHFTKVALRLGQTQALQDVNLQVAPGSIHCLVGPNGGGKSSLIRSLLGQTAHSGQISIHWRGPRLLSYVPQSLQLDPGLPITVQDFMALACQRRPAFLGLSRACRGAVDNALQELKMDHKRTRPIGSLSGGERQRMLFAQALVPAPRLLILDEPMAGLDRDGAQIIETAVVRLRQLGTTVFWVDHDLEQIKRCADAVTCLNQTAVTTGRPIEVLDPAALLALFSHSRVAPAARAREAASV